MTAPDDPELQAAQREYYSEPHPAYGAKVVVFWQGGTMDLRELACGECVCGFTALHETAAKALATLVTGAAVLLPDDVPVWHVQSGAPSAQAARSLALDIAKTLGWKLNPLLNEETTA